MKSSVHLKHPELLHKEYILFGRCWKHQMCLGKCRLLTWDLSLVCHKHSQNTFNIWLIVLIILTWFNHLQTFYTFTLYVIIVHISTCIQLCNVHKAYMYITYIKGSQGYVCTLPMCIILSHKITHPVKEMCSSLFPFKDFYFSFSSVLDSTAPKGNIQFFKC